MAPILNRKVLLLNQSYEPIMVVAARRAIILLLSDKVDSIENYSESIHSAYLTLRLPSVIRLREYTRIKKKDIVLSRKNILKRDNHTCQYCSITSVPMTLDHIIPRNKGGGDSWENLVAACVSCNTKKGNKILKDIKMRLIRVPKKPTNIMHLQKFVKQFQKSWRPYLFMNGGGDV